MANNSTGKRGFAAMDPERRREIASKGGKSSRRSNGKSSKSNAAASSSDDADATDTVQAKSSDK